MARIKDLLPPKVRRALADLAAVPQSAVADEFPIDLLEHVDEPSNGKCQEQPERLSASPTQRNHVDRPRPVERQHRKPRASFNVIVMSHARERARERFPGFKAARIVDEVHAALVAGRVSAVKPPGMSGGDFPCGLYVWTEDGDRIYGIMHGEDCFAVHTTMRREVAH